MNFSVVDLQSDQVIESGFASRDVAEEFASDFRREYHCRRPAVLRTLKKLRPGYRVTHLDVA
jgi:hypothetical protein